MDDPLALGFDFADSRFRARAWRFVRKYAEGGEDYLSDAICKMLPFECNCDQDKGEFKCREAAKLFLKDKTD